MAYSRLVQAFADAWGTVTGLFADNQFENVGPATFQNFSQANAALHDRGPNAQRGLHKRFRYVTTAEVLANGNEGQALEDLDFDTCCVGTQIVVQYYQPDPQVAATRDQVLVAVYDAALSHYVYSDGSFRDGDRIAPVKFVPATTPAAQYGYVRRDTVPAGISNWRVGELSIWELNSEDEFATAKQAGGPWPAFTGVEDAYWKPAAPPAAAGVTPAQLAAVATTLPLTTTRTADYTLALADAGCLVPVASSSPVTVTFPTSATAALGVGQLGYIRRMGTGPLTLAAAPGVQLLPPGVGLNVDDYGKVSWHKIDLNTFWLEGSLY